MDLFYRAVKKVQGGIAGALGNELLKFEDITSYLIEHEIDQSKNIGGVTMNYYESDIVDTTTHNNYIEKIYYFQQIDKVLLFE